MLRFAKNSETYDNYLYFYPILGLNTDGLKAELVLRLKEALGTSDTSQEATLETEATQEEAFSKPEGAEAEEAEEAQDPFSPKKRKLDETATLSEIPAADDASSEPAAAPASAAPAAVAAATSAVAPKRASQWANIETAQWWYYLDAEGKVHMLFVIFVAMVDAVMVARGPQHNPRFCSS